MAIFELFFPYLILFFFRMKLSTGSRRSVSTWKRSNKKLNFKKIQIITSHNIFEIWKNLINYFNWKELWRKDNTFPLTTTSNQQMTYNFKQTKSPLSENDMKLINSSNNFSFYQIWSFLNSLVFFLIWTNSFREFSSINARIGDDLILLFLNRF